MQTQAVFPVLCVSKQFTYYTLLVLPVLSERTKAVIQSRESPLARCLTLDELISLSKPYFYINKMDCELLINYGMQSVYHSV